jgi:hypothetical protein
MVYICLIRYFSDENFGWPILYVYYVAKASYSLFKTLCRLNFCYTLRGVVSDENLLLYLFTILQYLLRVQHVIICFRSNHEPREVEAVTGSGGECKLF